jgi:hypothetical protein
MCSVFRAVIRRLKYSNTSKCTLIKKITFILLRSQTRFCHVCSNIQGDFFENKNTIITKISLTHFAIFNKYIIFSYNSLLKYHDCSPRLRSSTTTGLRDESATSCPGVCLFHPKETKYYFRVDLSWPIVRHTPFSFCKWKSIQRRKLQGRKILVFDFLGLPLGVMQ